MNFSEEAGYHIALQILTNFNLPIRDKSNSFNKSAVQYTGTVSSTNPTLSTYCTSNTSFDTIATNAANFNRNLTSKSAYNLGKVLYPETEGAYPLLAPSPATALLPVLNPPYSLTEQAPPVSGQTSIVRHDERDSYQQGSYQRHISAQGTHVGESFTYNESPTVDPVRKSLFANGGNTRQSQESPVIYRPIRPRAPILPLVEDLPTSRAREPAVEEQEVAMKVKDLGKQATGNKARRGNPPKKAPKRRAATAKSKRRAIAESIKNSEDATAEKGAANDHPQISPPRKRVKNSSELIVKLPMGATLNTKVQRLLSTSPRKAAKSSLESHTPKLRRSYRNKDRLFTSTATQTDRNPKNSEATHVSVATQTEIGTELEPKECTLCKEASTQVAVLVGSTPNAHSSRVSSILSRKKRSKSLLSIPSPRLQPRSRVMPINKFGRNISRMSERDVKNSLALYERLTQRALPFKRVDNSSRSTAHRIRGPEQPLSMLPPAPSPPPQSTPTPVNKFGRSLSRMSRFDQQLTPLPPAPTPRSMRLPTQRQNFGNSLHRGSEPMTRLSSLPAASTSVAQRNASPAHWCGRSLVNEGEPEQRLSPLPPAPTPRAQRIPTPPIEKRRKLGRNKFRGPSRFSQL